MNIEFMLQGSWASWRNPKRGEEPIFFKCTIYICLCVYCMCHRHKIRTMDLGICVLTLVHTRIEHEKRSTTHMNDNEIFSDDLPYHLTGGNDLSLFFQHCCWQHCFDRYCFAKQLLAIPSSSVGSCHCCLCGLWYTHTHTHRLLRTCVFSVEFHFFSCSFSLVETLLYI